MNIYIIYLAGRHCCLWCHITTTELALSPTVRGPLVLRTTSTLQRDLNSFQSDGSNIKRAKHHNNVIRKSLFEIPLEQVSKYCNKGIHTLYIHIILASLQVSPPGLHISLGIFFRLFTLLEDECHKLDVIHSLSLQGSTAGFTFNRYTSALRRQTTLRDNIDRLSSQIHGLEQLLTLAVVSLPPNTPQTTALTHQLVEEITSRKDKKKEIVHG